MEITAHAFGITTIMKNLQAPVSKTTSERPRRKRTTYRTFDLDARKRVVSFFTTITMSADPSAYTTPAIFETIYHTVSDVNVQATRAIIRELKRIQKRTLEKTWERKVTTTTFS